jgi:hypothetical protein
VGSKQTIAVDGQLNSCRTTWESILNSYPIIFFKYKKKNYFFFFIIIQAPISDKPQDKEE